MLLLALQQITIPLDRGAPAGPAIFNTNCNVCYIAQIKFPRPVQSQQIAPADYLACCLAGRIGVLVLSLLKFYCCFKFLFFITVQKSIAYWCLNDDLFPKSRNVDLLINMMLNLQWLVLSLLPWALRAGSRAFLIAWGGCGPGALAPGVGEADRCLSLICPN